jgi:hypothetical protein
MPAVMSDDFPTMPAMTRDPLVSGLHRHRITVLKTPVGRCRIIGKK